jgi:hypothetical protein
MKLIERDWNEYLGKYENTWLANDESGVTADFDQEGAIGSMIIVIATENVFIKNTEGKWQKSGTNEVIE